MTLIKKSLIVLLFVNVAIVHAAHFGKFSMRPFTVSKSTKLSDIVENNSLINPSVHDNFADLQQQVDSMLSKKSYGNVLWRKHKEIGDALSRINNKELNEKFPKFHEYMQGRFNNLVGVFKKDLMGLDGENCSIPVTRINADSKDLFDASDACCSQNLLKLIENSSYNKANYPLIEEKLERVLHCIYGIKKHEREETSEVLRSLAKIKEFIDKNS